MLFQIANLEIYSWLCGCAARQSMPAADIKFVLDSAAITVRLARWLAPKRLRLASNY
jgi:hypothetical protein